MWKKFKTKLLNLITLQNSPILFLCLITIFLIGYLIINYDDFPVSEEKFNKMSYYDLRY